MTQTFFHNFRYLRKYDSICLTLYHCQPCIRSFPDITKGLILQKFLQANKRDYQHLIAVSSLLLSPNLKTWQLSLEPVNLGYQY